MITKNKALKLLVVYIVGLLALIAIVVYIMDPFYQYHAPYAGMPTVLYDREHQVVGTIRNLSYDSVLLGSSVAENFNTDYLDAQYNCETLKIIKASGSTADLLYYLTMAHEKQELKRVFWCMDIFALTGSAEVTLYDESVPKYLHTETVLDDYTYLFNKDILLMKIPVAMAYAYVGRNVGGQAYDWSEGKEFSAAKAMQAYVKPKENITAQLSEEEKELIAVNISMVLAEVTKHPEVEYTVLFPPYSMLWWDSGYVNGISEQYLYVLEQVLPQLSACENVTLHFFMAEEEIACNLDNYMDMIHYSPMINQYMLEALATENYLVDSANVEGVLAQMRDMHDYIVEEGIYKYYSK